MAIQVWNSLTNRKEPLEPFEKGHVGMYVCGLTVYDYAHIGHARTYVAFDVIRRYLLHRGYRVTHVQNVTDVDDKIINRAAETKEDPIALAARFTREAQADLDRLEIARADHYPKVTSSMHLIRALIERLVALGYAYEALGSVYFRVKKLPDYGKLSKIDPEQMLNEVRKACAWYARGLYGCNALRLRVWEAPDLATARALVDDYFSQLLERQRRLGLAPQGERGTMDASFAGEAAA
jgi:cysteinyl-tRNA synthetase